MKVTTSIAIVITCLLLAACEKHAESTAGTATPEAAAAASPIARTSPSITAAPNPVPAGSGAGTTTIKWTTGDGTTGNVFVSETGAEEKPFSSGPTGSTDAPWIQIGVNYEFRLYNSDHTKLLAKVTVTRAAQ